MEILEISKRFCGPPNSGNGGYVCGLIDNHTDFVSEVTLRKPPPLEVALQLYGKPGESNLMNEEILVAVAKPGTVDVEIPDSVEWEEAKASSKNYIGFQEKHPFPSCFVCGPQRASGDGLNVFAGKVEGRSVYASPWIPDKSLSNDEGTVKNEFLWAAMDCPGAFAIMGKQPKTLVLGRMTAEIEREVPIGETCVVISWKLESEGKKHFCGTAIYNSNHELCGKSKAIWIDIGG